MNKLIFLLVLAAIGWMGWAGQQHREQVAAVREQAQAASAAAPVTRAQREPIRLGGIAASPRGREALDLNALPPTAAGGPRCDGRRYCVQMTSCAEARYFLANCPGVKMDGNADGLPCEQQWCGAAAQRAHPDRH